MKTITGKTITATANHSRRTFTIRTESGKYRTLPMSKEEFQTCIHNTATDWQQFLRSDEYTVIK